MTETHHIHIIYIFYLFNNTGHPLGAFFYSLDMSRKKRERFYKIFVGNGIKEPIEIQKITEDELKVTYQVFGVFDRKKIKKAAAKLAL